MMVFISATEVFCHYELLGTLRSDNGDGNENGHGTLLLAVNGESKVENLNKKPLEFCYSLDSHSA